MLTTHAIFASFTLFTASAATLAVESAAPIQFNQGAVALSCFANWPSGRDVESLVFPIDADGGMGGGGAGSDGQRYNVSTKGFFALALAAGQAPTLTLSAVAADMNSCQRSGCRSHVSVGTLDGAKAAGIVFAIDHNCILATEASLVGASSWSLNAISGEIVPTVDGTTHLMAGSYQFDFLVTSDGGDASIELSLTFKAEMEGDFNGDGYVNSTDLNTLLAEWGPHPCGATTDLTHDCLVDENDVFQLLMIWSTVADE